MILALGAAGAGCLLRRRPALRHGLWLLVLLKLVTPPLWWVPVEPTPRGTLAALDDAGGAGVSWDASEPGFVLVDDVPDEAATVVEPGPTSPPGTPWVGLAMAA